MIISPPFLPASGLTCDDASKTDPMMDAVDQFEIGHHGVYPVAFDRRFHCGVHLNPGQQTEPVRAIADGEVVAYRVCRNAISDGAIDTSTGQPKLNSNAGFVLLKHTTDTGDGRTITFYSLYMHLLDMSGQQRVVPQPTSPPEVGSPNALPKWLLDTAEGKSGVVQAGGGKKVYRKDVLGYMGKHQDVPHLHFEIFMTESDFTAWFDHAGHAVQLGNRNPTQPTSKDYWGHSYFVIRGPQEFVAQPAGTNAAWFPRTPGGSIGEHDTLYVEAWFNKGRRYTQAWIDRGNSNKVTLLTPNPVADPYDSATKHYEYDLYDRAVALYPGCPSDGYEMLRFGRILSDQPTLTGAALATWIAVPFNESGTQGYVNVARDAVIKLSDADFPFFKDWQKVSGDNTPFKEDGLCGYDELCRLTGVADPQATTGVIQPLEYDRNNDNAANQRLAGYVRHAEGVRAKLRGLVCKARSEWDPSNNDDRYKNLNEPGGFFEKQKDTNPYGYAQFIEFLGKFQFLDKTPLAGQKLWYFHPLAFVRQFRRCGWLSMDDMTRCTRRTIRERGREVVRVSRNDLIGRLTNAGDRRPAHLHLNFQLIVRKYGISTSTLRLAHLFGQLTAETGRLEFMLEGGEPRYFDKYEPGTDQGKKLGNTMIGDGVRFKGRGLIQLTGRANYEKYGAFRARIFNVDATSSLLLSDSYNTCDASGWYWASKQRYRAETNLRTHKQQLVPLGELSISFWADQGSNDAAILQVTKCINPAGLAIDERSQGFRNAFYALNDIVVPSVDYLPVI